MLPGNYQFACWKLQCALQTSFSISTHAFCLNRRWDRRSHFSPCVLIVGTEVAGDRFAGASASAPLASSRGGKGAGKRAKAAGTKKGDKKGGGKGAGKGAGMPVKCCFCWRCPVELPNRVLAPFYGIACDQI
jgi:hypothetical protein